MQRNVDKIIESVKLNPKYCMSVKELRHLVNSREGKYSLAADAFEYGFALGMKALASEMVNSYE